GTVVVETFAALYPHRVALMVLDGVADMDAWFHGTARSGGNVQVDGAMRRFTQYCADAGPQHHAMFERFAQEVEMRL
ncbi:hypothetical protein EJ02DRAFT_302452, partial [Clathrospora elynae]